MAARSRIGSRRVIVAWRIAWTIASLLIVQTAICGAAAAPIVFAWRWILAVPDPIVRGAAISVAIAPSYVAFALVLMIVSPVALRLLGWRTPPDAEMRIVDMEWPLLDWVRYGASIHLVRVVAGALFRGTPLWTSHLRMNGARLGRRVYVNTVSLGDYNLIECGDDVVIGGGVHLSGHTVEAGIVKTARVRFGDRVTIGLGSVIEIGVEIGSDCQVGAMSFVPKFTSLAGGRIYVGAPAMPLD